MDFKARDFRKRFEFCSFFDLTSVKPRMLFKIEAKFALDVEKLTRNLIVITASAVEKFFKLPDRQSIVK